MKHNGEVSITGSSGKVYTLKNSFKGMAAIEEMFGMNFGDVAQLADKGSMRHTRALLWSLFQQRDPSMTIDSVDDFVDDCGGLDVVAKKMVEALTASVPDPKDVKAMRVPENPPAAQANHGKPRTGERSTSRPAAST